MQKDSMSFTTQITDTPCQNQASTQTDPRILTTQFTNTQSHKQASMQTNAGRSNETCQCDSDDSLLPYKFNFDKELQHNEYIRIVVNLNIDKNSFRHTQQMMPYTGEVKP